MLSRTAIVHDWLVTYAGSERVLEQLLVLYPQADVFCVCDFLPTSERGFLRGKRPKTTFIQNLPWARRFYRNYLPLMPLAIEQLDLSEYDLIISSSHSIAKGVLTGPDQLHVSYVYTPLRYAWDLQHQYLRGAGLDHGFKSWLVRYLLHRIRLWDLRTASGVDTFVADSAFIARRIWKTYRRKAEVIYPPVDVDAFTLREEKGDYYLTASRLVFYKRVDLIVEAFTKMSNRQLKVIGEGPERTKIERIAAGYKNIELLGYQPSSSLIDYMSNARAFVFAAEEDFGIAPVEAQACGTPVIAYGRGGALETVQGLDALAPTGIFFPTQTVDALIDATERFEREGSTIRATHCRINAERFSSMRFRKEFGTLVERERERFSQATV